MSLSPLDAIRLHSDRILAAIHLGDPDRLPALLQERDRLIAEALVSLEGARPDRAQVAALLTSEEQVAQAFAAAREEVARELQRLRAGRKATGAYYARPDAGIPARFLDQEG